MSNRLKCRSFEIYVVVAGQEDLVVSVPRRRLFTDLFSKELERTEVVTVTKEDGSEDVETTLVPMPRGRLFQVRNALRVAWKETPKARKEIAKLGSMLNEAIRRTRYGSGSSRLIAVG